MKSKYVSMSKCNVCACDSLDTILNLPKLPHIGIYLNPGDSQMAYEPIDNSLNYCTNCSHIQMQNAVDASFLYTTDFQHRTSESASAKQANDFLFDFITEYVAAKTPKLVAEIGCNDTFFLKKFIDKYDANVVGVDPILQGKEDEFLSTVDERTKNNFSIVGDFIENVNFSAKFGAQPDIVVSNFVFEHLKDPATVVTAMLESLSEEGIAVIGVPTAEFMLMNARFDQLSHQHYQQFNLHSLHLLVERQGGKVLSMKQNFTNWGQAVVIFRKAKGASECESSKFKKISKEYVLNSISIFHQNLASMKIKIDHISDGREIVGFGAAQNFPIFAYFYGKELPFTQIIDDHPLRQNKIFPFVENVTTIPAKNNYAGKIGVLTGPDYARVLFARMGGLAFDHIVSPFTSY